MIFAVKHFIIPIASCNTKATAILSSLSGILCTSDNNSVIVYLLTATLLLLSLLSLFMLKHLYKTKQQAKKHKITTEQDTIEFSSEWVWEVDLGGKVLYSSPQVKHILGYTTEEITGKFYFDFMDHQESERVKQYISLQTEQNKPLIDFINYNIHKNGQTIVLESNAVPVYDSNGKIRGYRGINRDITEKAAAQEVLKKSESRLRLALEVTEDGIWDWNLNTGEMFSNARCYTMLGYQPYEFEVTYETWKALVHPDDFEKSDIAIKQAIKSGQSYRIEYRCKHKDGRWIWILARGKCISKDSQGRPTRVVGTNTDLTQQKKAEYIIKKSESELNAIYDNAPVLLLLLDSNKNTLKINNEALSYTDKVKEQALGSSICKAFNCINSERYHNCGHHEECNNCDLKILIDETLETGNAIKNNTISLSLITAEGASEKTFYISTKLIREFDEKTVLVCLEDITDRKRAEESLKKRLVALTLPLNNPASITFEEMFNIADLQKLQDEFAEATGVASLITTPDGTPITKPSKFCRLCSEIIRKSEKGCANCHKSDAAIGKLCLDGPTIKPCLSGGLWDAGAGISVGGKHIANWLIGQVRDYTQTEEQMRENARKIEVDEDEYIKAFNEVPAMSYEQFEKISQVLFTITGQLSDIAYQNIQQARFITQAQQSQSALEESESRLREAQQMAQLGHWYWDIKTGKVKWSEEVYKIFDLDPNTFTPEIDSIMKLSPWPQEQQRNLELINIASKDNKLHEYEQRFLRPDGSEAYYFSTFQGIYGVNNDLIAIKGTIQDITDRKTAEQLIKNYNETLKQEVKARTDELTEKNNSLKEEISERKRAEKELKNATSQLVQSEKLATIGQLAAGVAHEINSPLGAIGSSNNTINSNFKEIVNVLKSGNSFTSSNCELLDELILRINNSSYEMSSRQNRMFKKELTEYFTKNNIENPSIVATLFTNIGITEDYQRYLPLLQQQDSNATIKILENIFAVTHATRIINTAVQQSSRVVNALREFAHSDDATEVTNANIRDTIDTALILYGNKIKHGVTLELNLEDVPNINCYPHRLSQVWTNLIQNAIQAINGTGTLTISLTQVAKDICVSISDTGCGIPKDNIDKIYEPLFTTKPVGEGTGLGLDITRSIIQKHNGTISVDSTVGKGTTFTVTIPIQ